MAEIKNIPPTILSFSGSSAKIMVMHTFVERDDSISNTTHASDFASDDIVSRGC